MNNFIENWCKNKKILEDNYVYSELDEHSSCGVGLIASLDGTPKREIVEMGVQALKVLYHRGAVDADGKTGDGAGIQLSIPKDFFIDKIERTGNKGNKYPFAVGMIFLPRTNFAAQEKSRTIVESEIIKEGLKIYGWRHVPINSSIIGDKEWADSMVITNTGLNVMKNWISNRVVADYSLSPDWDNRWRTGGSLEQIIDEAHLSPRWVMEAIDKFSNDRIKRLERLKQEIPDN